MKATLKRYGSYLRYRNNKPFAIAETWLIGYRNGFITFADAISDTRAIITTW